MTTQKFIRTDIHRPTVFDPEAYEYSHSGTFSPDEFLADVRKDAARMLRLRITEGWTWASHQHSGQCGHCGARITHYAVMLHIASHEMIMIGETCLDGRFEMATHEFKQWRKMRTGARAAEAKKSRIAALIENHPRLSILLDYQGDNDFLAELASKLLHYGELSEKQIEAAKKAIDRDIEWNKKKADEAEKLAALPPMVEGRRVITGTIVSKKWKENDFSPYGSSGSWKIVVVDAEGYRYWGTLPSAASELEQGAAITLTATITRKDNAFGFFKRPTVQG